MNLTAQGVAKVRRGRSLAAKAANCFKLSRWIAALFIAFFPLLRGLSAADDTRNFGPAFSRFDLALEPGTRTEILGPLFQLEHKPTETNWGVSPLFFHRADHDTDFEEFDFLYPLVTYDRFGKERRFQIFQVISFSGGADQADAEQKRLTLFPFYFQQRSTDPSQNYTAVLPFYGHLHKRLLRDEVKFVMLPVYVQTRKKDVVTDNYMLPFFHLRRGEKLEGWQLWPLVGAEHKGVTTRTNVADEVEIIGGHEKFFVLWPFFFRDRLGLGTTNALRHDVLLPFYSIQRSPARDSTTYFWPFGLTITEDREKKYRELGAPWPFIVFARGEGKTVNRLWPLLGRARNATLQSDFALWPLYKYNRATVDPLDRERTRILFFLYSDLRERDTRDKSEFRRTDFWPLFTARRERDGRERLQLFAPLEPFLPNNKSIERNYSPVWSLWRSEKNPATGVGSQSLLWNLYRRETAPDSKKCSLLFGMFQYQSGPDGRRGRVFYVPVGRPGRPGSSSAQP